MPEIAVILAAGLQKTALTGRQISAVEASFGKWLQGVGKAQTDDLLNQFFDGVKSILNPVEEERIDDEGKRSQVLVGKNPAQLQGDLEALLRTFPEGSVPDSFDLNFHIKTATDVANGAANFVQANNPESLPSWPAQELVRFEERAKPRNWDGKGTERPGSPFGTRWMLAAQTAGDPDAARILDATGRMVALKSSGIWQALGDGAGGYTDTLGSPYPPFAFNSGMWVQDVSREEAVDLGLLKKGEEPPVNPPDFAKLFSPIEEAA